MNLFDLGLEQDFQDCFEISSSPVVECKCGREHVCINSDYFQNDEEDERMAQDYIKRAETDDMLVLCYEYDSIAVIEIDHQHYAYDCECKGYERYMNFILANRHQIRDFLLKVSTKAQIALAHEKTFDILNQTKF